MAAVVSSRNVLAAVGWWPSVCRGYATGLLGYGVLFHVARHGIMRLSAELQRLSNPEKAEWCSCAVSTVNACAVVCAMAPHAFSRQVN